MDCRICGIGLNERSNMFGEVLCFSDGVVSVWKTSDWRYFFVIFAPCKILGANSPYSRLAALYLGQLLGEDSPICTRVATLCSTVFKLTLKMFQSTRHYPF